MKPITEAWMNSAYDDIRAMEQMLDLPDLTNIVAFHAQQAIEKTFKALIEEQEMNFARTHSLLRLSALVQPFYDLVQDMNMLEKLDSVYTEARYPDEMGLLPLGKPSLDESKIFYKFSVQIWKQAKAELEITPNS
ncbi:MAG: HEPN domain-containing protein [Anaerolineae bacterium]|nr:HEPN domain-containing protein [Anaerolineae bacterium]